jgi:hypothetical protein
MATQKISALEKFMAPPQNAGANDPKPQPVFAGFQRPSVDMDAVRDGRRAPLLYLDIPLDSTFSINAGNPLVLPLSGNSFYIDQDPSIVGNATVHFQDTNLQQSSAPIYVGPGFIAKVPFTQLLIENKTAQAGKKLRIVYGTDVDFTAGVNATIAVTDQSPVRFSGTSGQATATATASTLAAADATRKIFMLQNNGLLDVYVAFGVTATGATGFKVGAGSSLTLDASVPTSAISIISPSGSNSNLVYMVA